VEKQFRIRSPCIDSRMENSRRTSPAEFKYEYFYMINLLSIYTNGSKSLPVFPSASRFAPQGIGNPHDFMSVIENIARQFSCRLNVNRTRINSARKRSRNIFFSFDVKVKANPGVNLMKFINGSLLVNFLLLCHKDSKNLQFKDPSKRIDRKDPRRPFKRS